MADLPKTPVTRQEEYLSRLAGENTTLPIEPVTREEMYLEGAIERVEAVEEEVKEMKNNPDVADIVATYADLEAYDKSKLTDKDVIRVLADENHSGDSTYYRYSKSTNEFTYIGESKQYVDFVGTDGQTAGQNGLVPAPATTDANKFLKSDGTWAEVSGGGGGGSVHVLTTDDYNWNSVSHSATAPFDSIAPWLLYTGVYQFPADVYVALEKNSSKSTSTDFNNRGVFVSKEIGGTYDGWMAFLMFDSSIDNQRITMGVYDGSGTRQWETAGLVRSDIANNLSTSAYYKVLSAAQGKVLNEKITPTSSSGAPTTSTVGDLGKIYIDTSTDTAYMCVKVSGSTYTWKQITA